MRKVKAGIPEYRIPSKKEQLIRKLSHHPLLRPPIKKNLAFLHEIAKADHQLYLISSRYNFLREITNKLIKKYKFDKLFSELHFNFENKQAHIFKSEIINKLKLDAYIDDDLHLLKYVAGRNNKIRLFWLNNKLDKKIGSNIKAITDIRQMQEDLLKGINHE
jgi:hypothetical protein